MIDQLPPHNMELEQFLIGHMIKDPRDAHKALQIITPYDFYRDTHQMLAAAIAKCYAPTPENPDPMPDPSLISAELEAIYPPEESGIDWLMECIDRVHDAATMFSYDIVGEALKVRDFAQRRAMISKAQRLGASAYDYEKSVSEHLAKHRAALQSIERGGQQAARSLAELAAAADEEDAQKCYFELYDTLQIRGIVIPFGESGSGKTALALQEAVREAKRGQNVLILSLELADTEIAKRCKVHCRTAAEFVSLPITIVDAGQLTMIQIEDYIDRYKPDLAVIDHLSLVIARGDTVQSFRAISADLIRLHKTYKCTIIALGQRNSSGANNAPNSAPKQSELYGGKALANAAAAIVCIDQPREQANKRTLWLIKSRYSSTGKKVVKFNGKHGRFEPIKI